MSTLPTRSFSTIVSNIAAGMQGRLPTFLNFAVGSVLLVVAEAFAGILLWLQGMVLAVAMLTRLQTSFGPDADSWVADFGIMERIGAVAATGLVVFGRYTASGAAPVIPVGTQVKTSDGTQAFSVYADTSNPAYSPTAGGTAQAPIAGYVMPAQITSLIVPVISITNGVSGLPGANGNVAAGAIALVSSSGANGIDTVTNPSAFSNGSDAETDPAFKARFRFALASLARGTPPAIVFAITSLQTNLQAKVLSGQSLYGLPTPGFVSVIVDDGSGAISDTLLSKCATAAYSYLAAGVRMGVFKATRQNVGVQLALTVLPGYQRQNVAAVVSATIASNINQLGLGNGAGYFTIGSWAVNVPGVDRIDGLLVNSALLDLPATPRITFKCSGVRVS